MIQRIKLAFASGSDDLIPSLIEELHKIEPELPLWLVSEFPPPVPVDKWIRWFPAKDFADNRARVRFHTQAVEVAYAAILLQPRMPYWPMRAMPALEWPLRLLVYNENLDHFMLRPRSVPVIARHLLWRAKNFVRWETRPGGTLYTWIWRLLHPGSLRRPLAYWRASTEIPSSGPPVAAPRPLALGTAVVIPSRNGRELLERLFQSLIPEQPDQIIIVDNGSNDGTAAWLAEAHPMVEVIVSKEPLSFAAAVNRGIARVSTGRVCLLNNDMVVEPGFLAALRSHFDRVPALFAATAQIFFPEGVRREETGKAMFRPSSKEQFPLWCEDPLPGEDGTWVLYGSGGCTLYDVAKLRALGGFGEQYTPAYVEDLDIGWRAWRAGWPTVFAAQARVEHRHRSTTSRYFSAFELECAIERNFIKFAASSGSQRLWRVAVNRLNHLAARQQPVRSAELALLAAPKLARTQPAAPAGPDSALDLCAGAVAVFPGRPAEARQTVVVAAPYLPFPLSHGGAVRMYNLMREAALEFDQVLVVFVEELQTPPPELLEIFSEIVLVRRDGTHLLPSSPRPDVVEEHDSPAFRAALQWTLHKWRPSAVQLEFTQMGLYAPDCKPSKTILVEHDITLDLYAQLLAGKEDYDTREQHRRWDSFERQLWAGVDAVVVMSDKDRDTVGLANAITIRNGVDLDRFVPGGDEPDPNTLLFIGSFAHLPNVMALDFFLREVWPLLRGARLHIIAGQRHEYYLDRYADRVRLDLAQPGIRVEGFVSDVREAYRNAAIVVAPLVASAGTNIKIMEAMAMRKAIVSTPAGINGLDLTDGHDVIVAANGPAMAAAIQQLTRDTDARHRLEANARDTVEREFGWPSIGRVQADLYRRLQ